METLAERWRRLEPHLTIDRPDGPGPFPVVFLHPGCGGVRLHLKRYARAAVGAGWMAVTVESFKARGWSEAFTRRFVCYGLLLRGAERAGDVLAAAHHVGDIAGADPSRIALAGWSHGGWAVMDAMTLPLDGGAEAGLKDGGDADLSGLKGLFLAYPFVGFIAASRHKDWRRGGPVLAMLPQPDHLATLGVYARAFTHAEAGGAVVEQWAPDATHAFDEPGLTHPKIRYDEVLAEQAFARFAAFLKRIA